MGRDQRFDPQRILHVLREIEGDVIALQEVPLVDERGTEFLELARQATRLSAIAGPTLRQRSQHYGNALLTRFLVRAVRYVDLSVGEREPRGAIDADLEIAGQILQVITTHLGLLPSERRRQIKRLLNLVQDRLHPVALLGDINEWFAWGRPLRWLHAHFGKPPAPLTFPSWYPLFALDRIWISQPSWIKSIEAHVSPLARIASDHLPVIALVESR